MVESFFKVQGFSDYQSMIKAQCESLDLPLPSNEELEVSFDNFQAICEHINRSSRQCISSADFIKMALYLPGSGYYVAGKPILGESGDFITAPEISSIFSRAIAEVIRPTLTELNGVIVEFGAGTGALAEVLMHCLNNEIKEYVIMEVSPALRMTQQARLHSIAKNLSIKLRWIDSIGQLPKQAMVFANEVLDAIPSYCFRINSNEFEELAVTLQDGHFSCIWRPVFSDDLQQWLQQHADKHDWQPDVMYEAAPWRSSWLASIARQMTQCAMLLIDYGYGADEFYHQQRQQGSLQCFYRHRRHNKFHYLTGLQDITSHVNFSELSFTADEDGLQVSGFTSQAQLMLQSGVLEQLQLSDDLTGRLKLSQALQKLMMPGEMGETIKAIAFTKGISENARPKLSSELLTRL